MSSTIRYRQAALVYFAYGVYYLAGIIGLGWRSGWVMHGYSPIFAWVLVPIGALITVGFPIVIWRGVRWFTRALAIVVFARSVYLFTQMTIPSFSSPFIVAAVAAWMLTRAGWQDRISS